MNLDKWVSDLTAMAFAKGEDTPPLSLVNGLPDMLLRDRMIGEFFLEIIRLRERVEELETKLYSE